MLCKRGREKKAPTTTTTTTTRSKVKDAKGLRSRKEQLLQAAKFYHEKIKRDEQGKKGTESAAKARRKRAN